MTLKHLKVLTPFVVLSCFALMQAPANAQTWPSKTVTFVVPFAPGNGPDSLARLLASHMTDKLQQTFIVENKPGANGNIGGATVAKAAPDGHTFLLATPGISVQNKYIYKTMPYDFDRDFVPVAMIAKAPLLLLVRPNHPAKTLPELLDYAKKNPNKVSWSTTGVASQGDITLTMLERISGTQMVHIPYSNSPQATMDVMSGQVDASLNYSTISLGPIQDGKLRALAVASKERLPQLPDVPTLMELGFPDFEAVGWYALLAPSKTPPEIVARMNQSTNDYFNSPMGQDHIKKLIMQNATGSVDDLRAWIKKENDRWGPFIREVAKPQ